MGKEELEYFMKRETTKNSTIASVGQEPEMVL
jgi:hypothetical protein